MYIRTYFLVETMWCSPLSSYNHNIKTYLSNLWHANCYQKYWHLVNQHPTSHIANMLHSQHLTSHIPNIPHAKHPTSPTSQIFSIPHPQLSTYPNIPHTQHSTSLTSHIPHIAISKYPTSQTSHIANIPHPEHKLLNRQKNVKANFICSIHYFIQIYIPAHKGLGIGNKKIKYLIYNLLP